MRPPDAREAAPLSQRRQLPPLARRQGYPPADRSHAGHARSVAVERAAYPKLARRIEQEAEAGRNVRLKPETAKKVALALYTVADGPMPWEGLKSYGHRVVRYSSSDAGEVLAFFRGVDLAIGAYEAACAKLPGARLAVRWGVFTPRKNF
jgi:hypothetical protein